MIAKKNNKIYISYDDRFKLILDAHYNYTGHIRLAKLHGFFCKRFYWKEMFNNIKEIIE